MTRSRVLIIDDNDMNVQLTTFVLGIAGFEVEAAGNASCGMIQIAAFRPDLILMDIQMSGMDGLEMTRRLKADWATRHIVIVAYTAYAMKGDEIKFRSAGCDGYLAKPIDVDTFASTVRSYLAARMKSLDISAQR